MASAENEDLDLFPKEPLQVEIKDRLTVPIDPLADPDMDQVRFYIPNRVDNRFIDPKEFYLRVELDIQEIGTKTKLTANKKVGPINNVIHSIFSNVEVQLNNTVVSEPSNNHAFLCYIAKLLSHDNEYFRQKGWIFGWNKDEAGQMENKVPVFKSDVTKAEVSGTNVVTEVAKDGNPLGTRKNWWFYEKNGNLLYKTAEFQDRLMVAPLNQERFIPFGVDLYITLTKASPQFYMMNDEDGKNYEISVKKAQLLVDYVILESSLFQKITSVKRPLIRLPLLRSTVIPKDIESGIWKKNITHLFDGKPLPKRIVIGFVDNQNYAGHYEKNPFNFKHFNINYLQVYKNGTRLKSLPFEPDFAKNNYLDSFLSLYQGTGLRIHHNECLDIEKQEYSRGFTFWVYDLTGDLAAGSETRHLTEFGDLNIELRFGSATSEVITCLVYAEFEDEITIDNHGVILRSWDAPR